jgi:hypothetical protein
MSRAWYRSTNGIYASCFVRVDDVRPHAPDHVPACFKTERPFANC